MSKKPNTKQQVREAKQALRAGADPVAAMRGLFDGKVALAISAGPSMKHWREVYEQLQGDGDGDGDVVVACVKQTIGAVGVLCDVHFLNPYNHQKYAGDISQRLVVFTDVPGGARVFGHTDIWCEISKKPEDRIAATLAATKEFGAWDFDTTGLARPWGPGIMHEVVLYALLHMGVRRVVTVGWDIADASGENSHFYDGPSSTTRGVQVAKRKLTNAMRKNALWRTPWFYLLHSLGKRYNPPSLLHGEAETISASLSDFIDWFRRQGLLVELVSDSPWVLDNCPDYSRPTSTIGTLTP